MTRIIPEDVYRMNGLDGSSELILRPRNKDFNRVFSINPRNKNIALIGAAGSGKTSFILEQDIKRILKSHESLIVTDVHSMLFDKYAEQFRTDGYIVKCLNLTDVKNSDSWNCFSEIYKESQAHDIAKEIVLNVLRSSRDEFWDTSERNLLEALILCIAFGGGFLEDKRKFYTISQLIEKAMERPPFLLNDIFHQSMMPAMSECLKIRTLDLYHTFSDLPISTRYAILTDLALKLQVFKEDIFNKSNIDLQCPAIKPCAYFIELDTLSIGEPNMLASLFISFLLQSLVAYTKKNQNGCPVPVNILLDEFQNFMNVLDLERHLDELKDNSVHLMISIQSILQLQGKYPDGGWGSLLNKFDCFIFTNCLDMMTAAFASQISGKNFVIDNNQKSYENPRFTIQELLKLPNDVCFVVTFDSMGSFCCLI